MGNWKSRLREIAARNPSVLPTWMHGTSVNDSWYRTSWHTEFGTSFDDAARPLLLMLNWLARRGLLTRQGQTVLQTVGSTSELSLSPSLVEPKGAEFLSLHWNPWWELHGINLVMDAGYAETAQSGIEERWRQFGIDRKRT